MIDSFLLMTALAGIGVALAAAPLGCFVVWRRMAYFGDATAHAALLGVALALALNLSVFVGVVCLTLVMALAVTSLTSRGYAMDTLLGVMAHSALALGLVAVSFIQGVRIDLMAYLFGDILAVGTTDLLVIWGGAIAVIALLTWRWSALLTSTLNVDLAKASGIDPKREELILTVALAITIAVAIKVIGVLLIASMLIIPAASARQLASTPERMAFTAAALGCVSVVSGILASFTFDTPTGPTIVCATALLFCLANIAALFRRAA